MRAVVTGLIASFPLGGMAWDYLGHVAGLQRLGFDVLYLEDTGRWLYDPIAATYVEDGRAHAAYLAGVLERFVPGVRWSLRDAREVHHGLAEDAVARFCRSADLFLNVSGSCWLRDAYRQARHTVYLDTDPGYDHAKLEAVERGDASVSEAHSVALLRAHDCVFTYAEAIGTPECRLSSCGLGWRRTRPPVLLDQWRVAAVAPAARYTTVMSWKTDERLPLLGGVRYRGKDVELLSCAELPGFTRAPLEIALAGDGPADELRRRGWSVVDARTVSATPEAYRDYLIASRGEWSVAKNVYVATRSGWFSGRTACYLALGRPAVVQDTGFSRRLPVGRGLLAFDDVSAAAAALDDVESDYERHREAARAIAESEFDARVVLARLCRDAGL